MYYIYQHINNNKNNIYMICYKLGRNQEFYNKLSTIYKAQTFYKKKNYLDT